MLFKWVCNDIFWFFVSFCLGHGCVVDLLLKSGANIDIESNNKETPLHSAVKYGKFFMILTYLVVLESDSSEKIMKRTKKEYRS